MNIKELVKSKKNLETKEERLNKWSNQEVTENELSG